MVGKGCGGINCYPVGMINNESIGLGRGNAEESEDLGMRNDGMLLL
jgi:hypothetical protein